MPKRTKTSLSDLKRSLQELKEIVEQTQAVSQKEPEIMFMGEVATYLRLSVRSIQRLTNKGILPSYKIGHSRFYHKEDIDKLRK